MKRLYKYLSYLFINVTIIGHWCKFDFFEKYGTIGKDVIVVHHLKPIHLKDDEGERQTINNALKDLACLCPNCHLIIHKDRNKMLSISEVKQLIN